jgi:hypothetical protein
MGEEHDVDDAEHALVESTSLLCIMLVIALLAEQTAHARKWVYVPEGLPAMTVGLVFAFLDYFTGDQITIDGVCVCVCVCACARHV